MSEFKCVLGESHTGSGASGEGTLLGEGLEKDFGLMCNLGTPSIREILG